MFRWWQRWKHSERKIPNHVYSRLGMRKWRVTENKQEIYRNGCKTQMLLGWLLAVPSQARPGRRWAWWSRSRTAIAGSCQWLCTWGTPSLPGTQPRRPWICWCLLGHTRADWVTAGSGNGATWFRKTINIYPGSFSQWQRLFQRDWNHMQHLIEFILRILIKLFLTSSQGNFTSNKRNLCSIFSCSVHLRAWKRKRTFKPSKAIIKKIMCTV